MKIRMCKLQKPMLTFEKLRKSLLYFSVLIYNQSRRLSYPVSSLLLFFSLFVGLFLVPSYGISWDEPSLRSHGTFNLINALKMLFPFLLPAKYFMCNMNVCFPSLEHWNAWTHGAWFEMLMSGLEVPFGFEKTSILGQENMHDIYIMRHIVTFLFCWFGLANLVYFISREFKSDWLATASIVLAIASPRVFANAFYNSKDLIFCSMIAICMNCFSSYIHNPKQRKFYLLAFVLGLSAGIRIIGLLLIAIAICFLYLWHNKKRYLSKIRIIRRLMFFGSVSFITLVASMPYLWRSPFVRLYKVLIGNGNFDWGGTVIFAGKAYQPMTGDLPRAFLPVWLLISIPIFQLTLLLIGIVYGIRKVTSKPRINLVSDQIITATVFFSFCLSCFLITIVLNPTNYGEWRHYYFFSPVFILLECITIYMMRKKLQIHFSQTISKTLLGLLLILGTSPTFVWIVRNHPVQNLYMNKFAGDNIQHRWEWNGEMGNVNALRWILKADKRDKIIIGTMSDTMLPNALILLKESEKRRLRLLEYRQNSIESHYPDYVINTFYGLSRSAFFANYSLVKEYNVNTTPYLQIYKRNI